MAAAAAARRAARSAAAAAAAAAGLAGSVAGGGGLGVAVRARSAAVAAIATAAAAARAGGAHWASGGGSTRGRAAAPLRCFSAGGDGGCEDNGGEAAREEGAQARRAEDGFDTYLSPIPTNEDAEERLARVMREELGEHWEAFSQERRDEAVVSGADGTLWRRDLDGVWLYWPPEGKNAGKWNSTLVQLPVFPAHRTGPAEVDAIPNPAIAMQIGPDRTVEYELPETPGVWTQIGKADFETVAAAEDKRAALDEARVLGRYDGRAAGEGGRALDPVAVARRREAQAAQASGGALGHDADVDDDVQADARSEEDITLLKVMEKEADEEARRRDVHGGRGSRFGQAEDRSKDPGDEVRWQSAQLSVSVSQKPAGAKTINTIQPVVVVGNGKGLVGFGLGGAEDPGDANENAQRIAKRNVVYIDRREERTLWEEAKVKYKRSHVHVWPLPRGAGLRCAPVVQKIAELVGIKDMGAKLRGSMNHKTLVPAILKALATPRSPQEMMQERGLPIASLQERSQRRLQRQLSTRPVFKKRVETYSENMRIRLAAALGVAPDAVPGKSAVERAADSVKFMEETKSKAQRD